MTLDLLVSYYEEPSEIVERFLDNVDKQRNIDRSKLRVIIGSDGTKAPSICLDNYKTTIVLKEYEEHQGLQGTRNRLLDDSDADYVMWCDIDDVFFSDLGIQTIFDYIDMCKFDAFFSLFYEEHIREDGKHIYVPRDKDSTFVHGKVYRRQYLIDHNIRWHRYLKRHADSCFNVVAQLLAEKIVYCNFPFYLWMDRPGSISRTSKYDRAESYYRFIWSMKQLCKDLIDRERVDDAAFYANLLVFDAFFKMKLKEWSVAPSEYKTKTLYELRRFIDEYLWLFESITPERKAAAFLSKQKMGKAEGCDGDAKEFEAWMNHLMEFNFTVEYGPLVSTDIN